MLHSIPRVSLRPWSTVTIRRVWKTESLPSLQFLVTKRAYGAAISRVRAAKPATKSTATQTAAKKKAAITKPTRKPVKKTAKKTAAKPKRKPAPKKKKKPAAKKKPLTERQKELIAKKKAYDKLIALKETALLSSEPDTLPINAYRVFISEQCAGRAGSATELLKAAVLAYKSLPAAEHERLNLISQQNIATNEVNLKKWISTFTPGQIRKANFARRALKRQTPSGRPSKKYKILPDERQPKTPLNSFVLFNRDKWASGAFKGIKVGESTKLLKADWDALSAAERKIYEDQAKADLLRYRQERDTVFQ